MLLALMVLALIIAGIAKGCGDDEPTASAVTNTNTTGTSTAPTPDPNAQSVISEINTAISGQGGIQFATGQTELTDESKAILDNVATILQRNTSVNAEVQGHTDTQGDAAKNKQISAQRATAVVEYLNGKGVEPGRLSAVGYGEENPIVANDTTEEQQKQNRRIEFKLKA